MRRAVFRIRFSARGLGRQFLKSPGNFLVPKIKQSNQEKVTLSYGERD